MKLGEHCKTITSELKNFNFEPNLIDRGDCRRYPKMEAEYWKQFSTCIFNVKRFVVIEPR